MSKKEEKVEVIELWVKHPLLQLRSFDGGETWKNTHVQFYPFVEFDREVNYYYRKFKMPQAIHKAQELKARSVSNE